MSLEKFYPLLFAWPEQTRLKGEAGVTINER